MCRAAKGVHERPYTALSAWMAVDGSAYQSPNPLPKENITNLLEDLDPVMDRVKEDRLNAGLPFEQAVCCPAYARLRSNKCTP